jgi:signal transduction histidine kinase
MVMADGWAYRPGHVFGPSQTLGVIWPLSGVLAAGVAFGAVWGAVAGGLFGLDRVFDGWANGTSDFNSHRILSMVSTGIVYGMAGAVVGYMIRLLRTAREEVAAARAREHVARTLHDGVLQTLAAIERRTEEPHTARLARDQERELRDYLFRTSPSPRSASVQDLAATLRAAAARFEDAFGSSAEVLVADDVPSLPRAQADALAGAVGEALTNAGKHGHAQRVTLYVEPFEAGGIFCSVKDDGAGFDPNVVAEGVGLKGSVRARIAEVGGRVVVRSAPGEGTEVCLWLG